MELPTEWVELEDGALEIARFGKPGGVPLLYFHGWPSSLCQARPSDPAARECGFELISVNRPGIGHSVPRPGMDFVDWPGIMANLLDKLGFPRAAVMGVSGGAPYALACGAFLPKRFPQLSVVCGAPPLADDFRPWRKDTALIYQILAKLSERAPQVVTSLLGMAAPVLGHRPPWWLYQWGSHGLCEGDRKAVGNPDISDSSFGSFQGAIDSGARRVMEEGMRYLKPWGFELGQVKAEVTVWHGAGDKNFHWTLAERLVKLLPKGRLALRDDQGHYSLALLVVDQILAELRERWDTMGE